MSMRTFCLITTLLIVSPSSSAQKAQTLKGLTLRVDEIPYKIMALTRKKLFPKKLPAKRGPAAFAAGYRQTKAKCLVYRHPSPISPRIGSLKNGARIWLEGVNTSWARGFYRKKSFYIPVKCLK